MKSYDATIQMKPLQRYFHMVPFIYYAVLTFESVDEILWCYHLNETSSAVLSHGTIYLVCSSSESVDEILWCYHSNETSSAVLSQGIIYYVYACSSKFWGCGRNPVVWTFKLNLFGSTFTRYYLKVCSPVVRETIWHKPSKKGLETVEEQVKTWSHGLCFQCIMTRTIYHAIVFSH